MAGCAQRVQRPARRAVASSSRSCIRLVPSARPRPLARPTAAMAAADHDPAVAGTFSSLLLTCAIMFLGAFGSGTLPLCTTYNEKKLRLANIAGAGMLVGAGMAVILPEGFEAIHEAQEHSGDPGGSALPEWAAGAALVAGFGVMLLLEAAAHGIGSGGHAHRRHHPLGDRSSPPVSPGEDHSGANDHNPLGGTLEVSVHMPAVVEMQPLVAGRDASEDGRGGALSGSVKRLSTTMQDPGSNTLMGLLVHAAADGLAVGAASLSSNLSLNISVAAAMVLHKLPVAAGLTAFLNGQPTWREGRRVWQGLLAFSVASPVAAIATALVLRAAPGLSSESSIALAVLFSGGTFLYAACVHVFPSVGPVRDARQAAAVGAGMLLPLFLSSLLPHHHH